MLRDGIRTGVSNVAKIDQDWLVAKMIGRRFEGHRSTRGFGSVALELDGLSSPGAFDAVSLSVRAGEIVGLAGLVGAGRTEVAQAVFGVRRTSAGEIRLFGKPARIRGPRDAAGKGIGYVSEDRKAFGLLPNRPVWEHATIGNLARFASFGVLSTRKEKAFVRGQIAELDIRLGSMQAEIRTQSGGNQQKVLIGPPSRGSRGS